MKLKKHTVEKIGGTSMSDYESVKNNVILAQPNGKHSYQRIMVVSAYGGITNKLLEHKKGGKPGVYALFASSEEDDGWMEALENLKHEIYQINESLFSDETIRKEADEFIKERLYEAEICLQDLQRLCKHGHFSLEEHLSVVREMLSSIGEAHSAWNMSRLLQLDGINSKFVDLTAWKTNRHMSLDDRIETAFKEVDLNKELPIVTGYAHSDRGLMSTFDRGYSEMTFSRIAVITNAKEAIIHKEFHLSSADPKLVGDDNAVPIGRTNYDVADQLANLGMEAIHPKAAKGLQQKGIPLRVKNTFEPEHAGTLITGDYVSDKPRVEIIAGCKGVYAIEVFSRDMAGNIAQYDKDILDVLKQFKAHIITKDINANTITHYLKTNLKTVKRIRKVLEGKFEGAVIDQKKVAVVSAIGSDMQVPGLLAKTVKAISDVDISVLAMHQSMRQVDMQFIIEEEDYEDSIISLHRCLIEVYDHGDAICLAS